MTKYNFKELISGIKGRKYTLLGAGSSRRVYDLNNGYVIKMAIDVRGIHQNKAEQRIYTSAESKLFAEVVDVSEDFRCLIMPKADKIRSIETVCKYYNVRNIKFLIYDRISKDIRKNNLSKPDLIRASSWGMINGIPMIIDYGLTQEIFRKYYGLNKFLKKFKPLRYS